MSQNKGKGREPEAVYISAGCNRYSNVADVRNEDGLTVFGAGKLVALWNSEDDQHTGVHKTLPGHTGDVTTVKFLRHNDSALRCTSFASGDTSGKFIVWMESSDKDFTQVAEVTLPGSITSVASVQESTNGFLLAAGTSHNAVHLFSYSIKGDLVPLNDPLLLGSRIPLDIALAHLPDDTGIIMAVGTTDSKIHIYTEDPRVVPSRAQSSSLEKARSQLTYIPREVLVGHTDWVRCLAFTQPLKLSKSEEDSYGYKSGDVLLASGSQDTYTRLWRFASSPASNTGGDQKTAIDELDRLMEDEIDAKQYAVSLGSTNISIHSEAVLLGHENWVTGLHWRVHGTGIPQLLSASADRSMMMWDLDTATKIWLSNNRFGEIGGTNLGFFGALWGKEGKTVLAHGWGGSFHAWTLKEGLWKSRLSISGHYGDVTSLAWEPKGHYLISVSTDQTARLHGSWNRNGVSTWHELARPQIHGYDMEDVAFLSRLRYISGSEEKIVRVFDAPALFIESMRELGVDSSLVNDGQRPSAAAVPALGLSNKAVFEGTASESNDYNGLVSAQPPLEEQLLTSTLWPETEKLYGHGYEINAIAASHDGSLVASACRATTAEHAVVRLHSTSDWAQIRPTLAGHTLTVTSIRFSPDDRFILTASRDRSWQLYERAENGMNFVHRAASAKAHARIIWDSAWAFDGSFFGTASRDKQVKIWKPTKPDASEWRAVATLACNDAATSLDFTRRDQLHLLAVGTEAGHVLLFTSEDGETWTKTYHLDSSIAHCATVQVVAWQPTTHKGMDLLATGSDDRSVRVLSIPVSR